MYHKPVRLVEIELQNNALVESSSWQGLLLGRRPELNTYGNPTHCGRNLPMGVLGSSSRGGTCNLQSETTSTGKLSMKSAHGLSSDGLTVRSALHTALLHLKPEPKAICHTRSPRCTRPLASEYASSYHKELLEVLPNLHTTRFENINSSTYIIQFQQ